MHAERTARRRSDADDYKIATVTTRIGKVTFDAPQMRDSRLYPQALVKGLRSKRALNPGAG